MLISERIFELIKERGMSQKEFSIKTGIPQSTISDWKGKRINPSADKILIICRVLEAEPYDILSDTAPDDEQQDYVTVSKSSAEYRLIEQYRKLSKSQKDRLTGYMDCIMEKKK